MGAEAAECWIRSFGGVGNANGVCLAVGGARIEAPTAASASRSAFLTVAVLHGDRPQPWRHALLGERVGVGARRRLGARGGAVEVVVNDGKFAVPVEGAVGLVEEMWSEVFELAPAWGERDGVAYNTCITVIFYLAGRTRTDAEPNPLAEMRGWACSGRCDHLGLVLMHEPIVRRAIEESGVPAPHDLVALLGSDDLANRLVAAGALIPVWGMRPWLYRVASPSSSASGAPLGVRVDEARRYPLPPGFRGLTITRGSALRSWRDFDARSWPCLTLPADSAALEIELRTLAGHEPIAPEVEVGVLPTLVVRGSRAPADDPPVLLDGADPFEPPATRAGLMDCVL